MFDVQLDGGSVHIVLVQETKVRADELEALSQSAYAQGWKPFWAPALSGAKGGASAGVLILARAWLDAWTDGPSPADGMVYAGRAVRCFLRTKDLGTLAIYLVYGDCTGGVTGNAPLHKALVEDVRRHGVPSVLGGDWNLDPPDVHMVVAKGVRGAVGQTEIVRD